MNKLTIYNLSVTFETNEFILQRHIDNFLSKFYTLKQRTFSFKGQNVNKVFAGKILDRGIYQLHVTQFVHLYQHLKEINYELKIDEKIDNRDYNVISTDFKVRDGWELRENQLPPYNFILNNPTKSKLIPLATGVGKAQPLDAFIKVPGGWLQMADMKVGSVITNIYGNETTVTGVYPQGRTPVYKVTFEDGRFTEASNNHLWKVYIDDKVTVQTTLKLKELLEYNKDIYIDLIKSENIEDVPVPMDPYLFGKFIKDNNDTFNAIKIIPYSYMYASTSQRLKLIKGLLGDKTYFRTKFYKLAVNVQYLIRSVGGVCYIEKENDDYLVKTKYMNNKLKLTRIEYVGYKETQCISVEDPSRCYITNDFIITHNTFISLSAIGALKQRLGIVILSRFIEKWVRDIVKIHEAVPTDVMVVQGSKALSSLIRMAKEDTVPYNYFIFSAETLQSFVSSYESNPEETVEYYGCSPLELFPLMNIGIMLNDETHMSFHLIFLILIYMNVKYQIGLSATLLSDDFIVRRMHKVVYPSDCIYADSGIEKYTDVYAIAYSSNDNNKKHIKTTNYGSNNYSHIAFEQSLIRREHLLNNYFKIIRDTIEIYYTDNYLDKDKVIIFVSTIKLANKLLEYLKTYYPNKIVKRYCEDDDYEDLMQAEMIVTTVLSAGTGVDIPHLRVAIQTVSISSSSSSIQTLGRLRKLPDRDVKFCYLYCENITKQKEYHIKKTELFKDRVANIIYRKSRLGL